MRLLAMCEPAFKTLLELLTSEDEEIALKAAVAILDRAGYGAKATLAVTTSSDEDLTALSEEELANRAEVIAQRCRVAAERARLTTELKTIDIPSIPTV